MPKKQTASTRAEISIFGHYGLAQSQ